MRYVGLALVLALFAVAGWWVLQKQYASTDSQTPTTGAALAPEVETILSAKTGLLVALAADSEVVAAVEASNMRNASLSADDIRHLDAEWQASKTVTPQISQFMTNPTAKHLLAFQSGHPEFKEVFIADAFGLNMAQTDKTSDYYQADEAWWVNSFNGSAGRILHGDIEFDESSQTEAISAYVPVKNAAGKAIGVVKGVINLSALSSEL